MIRLCMDSEKLNNKAKSMKKRNVDWAVLAPPCASWHKNIHVQINEHFEEVLTQLFGFLAIRAMAYWGMMYLPSLSCFKPSKQRLYSFDPIKSSGSLIKSSSSRSILTS